MAQFTRRTFLRSSLAMFIAGSVANLCPGFVKWGHAYSPLDIKGRIFPGDAPKRLWKYAREGYFYQKSYGNKVACLVCPNHCILSPGDRSVCRSKVNLGGKLYSIAYGNACAANIDPIEKKPLYHFRPRTRTFSLAEAGCNQRCLNCQNWEISQARPEDVSFSELFPADAVKAAKSSGSASIAYTYSEPITFYEYLFDTAKLARDNALSNVIVSNGYINTEPLIKLCSVLDGASIDIKSFSDDIYRKLNGGRLDPVLSTLKTLHGHNVHLEISTLVVPGYTDDEGMVRRMSSWIVKNLGPDHPFHFLRFFPKYKLDRLPPTPVSTLIRFREVAMKEGIRYVYVGNVPEHEGNNTYCHSCGKLLIERNGYFIPIYNLDGRQCRFCKTVIPGVWG
ncbi:MAG TPA: AmmeMemoRadiSam system radical SAM enzyme [Desulfomonilia bacterium]|nr:AmmeMemoRadiSam system radical SAM enzyme [Desulfomonilia bacterium]